MSNVKVGDGEVGKSTFLSRLALGARSLQPILRAEPQPASQLPILHDLDQPFIFDIRMYNRPYRFEFYDTASPQNYTLLRPDVLILCYDITRRSTLYSLQTGWKSTIEGHFNYNEQIPIVVLGLKRDLRKEWTQAERDAGRLGESVMPQEGLRVTQEMRCDRYAECSALTGELCTLNGFKNIRDAPSQVEEFEEQSSSFCDNLLMFYETTSQHVPRLKEKVDERMKHAEGLIRQSERVDKGLKELLSRLEGVCKDASGPLENLRRLWEKIRWVLNQSQATRLKANMSLTIAQMSLFMNMLVLEAREATVVTDPVLKEENEKYILRLRGQARRQIPMIKSHRLRLEQLDEAEGSQSQTERRENRSITKSVKKFERSLKRQLDKHEPSPRRPQYASVNRPPARRNSLQTTTSPTRTETCSEGISSSNRSSELSYRSRPGEDISPSNNQSPVLRFSTSNQLRIPLSQGSNLYEVPRPVNSVLPDSSPAPSPLRTSARRPQVPIQAPRVRDRGFGPEESYGQWPDRVWDDSEIDVEPGDDVGHSFSSNASESHGLDGRDDNSVHVAPLAPHESRYKEETPRREAVLDSDHNFDDCMEHSVHRGNPGKAAQIHTRSKDAKRGTGLQMTRGLIDNGNDRRESDLHETRDPVNNGRAVQTPSRRFESLPRIVACQDSSRRSRCNANASEMRMRSLSNGTDHRGDKSWEQDVSDWHGEESEAEASRNHRGISRNQHISESSNGVGEERLDSKTSRLTTSEALATIHDASADYKRRKDLKKLAEKRKRDMRGVVTGDPEDDDEYKRRQRWARRR
ncbi:hypothetical protein EG327_008746 [Venturia inaequalis]|uniref:Uncharacterized protein n=1 Tax=Venturia inaequalis TaxID=5025 RepID=A0A8H3USB2_VENIN|nr:hypothetical protein EG327_008746 [Venturia inaequalis]